MRPKGVTKVKVKFEDNESSDLDQGHYQKRRLYTMFSTSGAINIWKVILVKFPLDNFGTLVG